MHIFIYVYIFVLFFFLCIILFMLFVMSNNNMSIIRFFELFHTRWLISLKIRRFNLNIRIIYVLFWQRENGENFIRFSSDREKKTCTMIIDGLTHFVALMKKIPRICSLHWKRCVEYLHSSLKCFIFKKMLHLIRPWIYLLLLLLPLSRRAKVINRTNSSRDKKRNKKLFLNLMCQPTSQAFAMRNGQARSFYYCFLH